MTRPTATEKLVAISLVLLAMISPLYIGKEAAKDEEDEESRKLRIWLPFVLILLIFCISLSTCFMDQRFMRFDPYWIHRVGGSSCGIFTFLLVLGFVLKCKACLGT